MHRLVLAILWSLKIKLMIMSTVFEYLKVCVCVCVELCSSQWQDCSSQSVGHKRVACMSPRSGLVSEDT
jgi:hypothetical protein